MNSYKLFCIPENLNNIILCLLYDITAEYEDVKVSNKIYFS